MDEEQEQAQAQTSQPIETQLKPKESKRRRTRRQRRRRQKKLQTRKQRGGDNQLYDWLKKIKNTEIYIKPSTYAVDQTTFQQLEQMLTSRSELLFDSSFTENITPILYARFSYENDSIERDIFSVAKAIKEILVTKGLMVGVLSDFANKINSVDIHPEIRDFLRTIEDLLQYKYDGSSGAPAVGAIALKDSLTDVEKYPLLIWALALCLRDTENTPPIPFIFPKRELTAEPEQKELPSP